VLKIDRTIAVPAARAAERSIDWVAWSTSAGAGSIADCGARSLVHGRATESVPVLDFFHRRHISDFIWHIYVRGYNRALTKVHLVRVVFVTRPS
jgi:hypothetical protein